MSDNRFAYMRKHLGISQKEASEIFRTRLDTIKKWDNGRLFVPERVLEEMYDLVRQTRKFIAEVVREYTFREEELSLAEIYLQIPDEVTRERFELPKSQGWIDRVIGGVIGDLAQVHAFAAHEIPDSYELDYQWYESWNWVFGEPSRDIGLVTVKDLARLEQDLDALVSEERFEVRYDVADHHYYIGLQTTALGKRTEVVWIKACSAGRMSEHLTDDHELRFSAHMGDELPFIYDQDERRINVGLQLDAPDPSLDEDEAFSDSYSLAELIYSRLSAKYPKTRDLRLVCRRKTKEDMGADNAGDVDDALMDWNVKDNTFLSHNFIVALFKTVRDQTGNYLYPEALKELCDIVRRSEPAQFGIDQQCLVIDMTDFEITVLLDLRDVLDGSKTDRTLNDEFAKAIEILLAAKNGDSISVIPSHSTFTIDVAGEDHGKG